MSRHQITPAWQTSRGSIVRASGCAAGVPVAGMRVFGETRQNLWVNPTGSSNGITVTNNDDGSITVDGTATAEMYSSGGIIYVLKPSTSYTLSVDKATDGFSFIVQLFKDGVWQSSPLSVSSNTSSSTQMPDSETFDYARFFIYVKSGETVSGTYRVMLNEGPTAEPWCPPGLTSVSELSVVTAGKNLLSRRRSATPPSSDLSASVAEDGAISISGTSTGSAWLVFGAARLFEGREYTLSCDQSMGTAMAYFQLYNEFGDFVVVGGASHGNSTTFTASGTGNYTLCFWTQGAGIKVDRTFRVQLELGSTATAYEPPAVTTPIDLDGHQLRSLPDGTRDVLAVDGSGAVSVEQNSVELVYNGDENWSDYQLGGNRPGLFGVNIKNVAVYPQVPFCDSYAVYSSSGGNITTYPDMMAGIDQNQNVWIRDSRFTTLEDFKANLASNPVIFVAALATPQTLALDPITPPTVPAADASLWAASDVPCELEATTWTASGAEQGRQQAAMVKVAQQVRQQAETVAALAAQSLEA